jgi:hypothetical protein
MAPGRGGGGWPDSQQGVMRDGGATCWGGSQRDADPDLGIRAVRCSPEDPARGCAVGAHRRLVGGAAGGGGCWAGEHRGIAARLPDEEAALD